MNSNRDVSEQDNYAGAILGAGGLLAAGAGLFFGGKALKKKFGGKKPPAPKNFKPITSKGPIRDVTKSETLQEIAKKRKDFLFEQAPNGTKNMFDESLNTARKMHSPVESVIKNPLTHFEGHGPTRQHVGDFLKRTQGDTAYQNFAKDLPPITPLQMATNNALTSK